MKRQLIIACIVLGAYFPLEILVHETGHYLAAKFFGAGADFTYSAVIFETAPLSTKSHCLVLAAGPLVNITLVLIGVIALRFASQGDHQPGWGYWIASSCVLAALRWFKGPMEGQRTDEAQISSMLGMPYFVIPYAILVPAALAVVYLVTVHYRKGTLAALGVGFLCALTGAFLWLSVIGPVLLPRP